MTDLSELTNRALLTIRETIEYKEYENALNLIKEEPDLFRRACELREKSFFLQKNTGEDVLQKIDSLTNEFQDVINSRLGSEFLRADAALCRLLQKFTYQLTEGLHFE